MPREPLRTDSPGVDDAVGPVVRADGIAAVAPLRDASEVTTDSIDHAPPDTAMGHDACHAQ